MRIILLVSTFFFGGCARVPDRTVTGITPTASSEAVFEGARAYQLVLKQMEFGPRTPGSTGHTQAGEWLKVQLQEFGWEVEVQEFTHGNYELRNIIARPSEALVDQKPLILGAHYDTRLLADKDLKDPQQPVPGANDGASGVAVLLELARVLDLDQIQRPIWLVFFDAEDNGRIEGWDWIMGSRYFVDQMEIVPEAAVIVDMVGDEDLQLYYEANSDAVLISAIWKTAEALGYEQFIPELKYHILDDHTPFLQANIPAVDIIDFDYPYHHTTEDLADKVSPQSLEAVGRTLEAWLEEQD